MDLVLIVVGVLLLIGMVIGLYKGAVRIAVSLLTSLVTLVLVTVATPYIADAIADHTPIDEMIQGRVEASMVSLVTEKLTGDAQEGGMSEDTVRAALSAAGVSEDALGQYGITVQDIVDGNVSSELLEEAGISEEAISQAVGEGISGAEGGAEISRDQQQAAIDGSELPEAFKKLLTTNNNEVIYEELGADSFTQYLGKFLAKIVIHILSFLCAFALVLIILRAVVFALDIVTELPMLGVINHLAGGVIGIFCALIIVWVIFVGVTLLYTAGIGKGVYQSIQDDSILRMIYEYNPVMRLATRF